MILWAAVLILHGVGFVGSMTGVPGVPENITVVFLSPTSVRVSWSTSQVDQVEKYDVTYKPTDARNETDEAYDAYLNRTMLNQTFSLSYYEPYNMTFDEERRNDTDSYRMVRLVAGNSDAVTLSDLQADTQYQLVITAVRAGKKYRSRPIVFRTLEPPRTSPQQDSTVTGGPIPPPPPSSSQHPQAYIQVRGVEVGIVVMVLIVWAGAIALFFNRWGKIRMLLPYQPDYKEQLKVPGTGVCTVPNAPCTQHSSQHACSQHLHWSSHRVDSLDSAVGGGGGLGWPRSSRPRVNSAIDVAGFLSQEFLRRHGSTSRLCRKVRSADNLTLTALNRQDERKNSSEDPEADTDREAFLLPSHEEEGKGEETELKKQNSSESESTKNNTHASLSELSDAQQPTFSTIASSITPSLITRRFSGWKLGGSHEYVRCPVRQPASVDERMYRRSCEPDIGTRSPQFHYHHHHHHHHHDHASPSSTHQSTENDKHLVRNRNYPKNTSVSSVEIQHFGLPILSISEPSPPDEKNRLDDYL
ncbi:uncharacterized protein [Chelonus insularis]|uniref:uncharacterized protein isoform X3 n=1 Tax=Chelonus insularis TaxID=460826 RepID=UPI00158C5C81|nr:uncharacterized protein LOC118068636 isoform X3 [Chelonus insularis]